MREIGTMWHIGVLTDKACISFVQNGSFSAFWHFKNKERTFERFGREMGTFLLLVLMPPGKRFSYWNL